MFDFATALGLLLGLAITLLAMVMGGDASLFLNFHAFIIIFGGVSAAALIRFQFKTFFQSLGRGLKLSLNQSNLNGTVLIEELALLTQVKRKNQPFPVSHSPALRQGLKLIEDGFEADYIRLTLERERETRLAHLEETARVFRTIGEIAPAFGMIGTLIGMVQMFANMSDPTSLGPYMATALLATLYSAVLANVIALPLAEKIERRVDEEDRYLTLVIEGILSLKQAKSPLYMRESLASLLPFNEKVLA
jgi:chemotaxis protein MotA